MPRKPVRVWNPALSRRGNGAGSAPTDSRSLSPRSRGRLTPPLPDSQPRPAPYKPALVFALTYCVGHSVSVQTRSGDFFEGILHTPGLVQSDVHFVLKKARKLTQEEGEGSFIERLVIPSTEIVHLYAKDLPIHPDPPPRPSASPVLNLPIKTAGDQFIYRFGDFDDIGFLGDKDQERVGAGLFGRELQKWEPEGDGALLEFNDNEHQVGDWDQFAENEKKFGVKSDFNMDLYTTRLQPEKSRYTVAQAEKLARAIQSASSPNLHIQDERNQLTIDDSGVSDEMLYSSVLTEPLERKSEANEETPKKSESPERPAVEEKEIASPKSPEAKKSATIPLILPTNHTRPIIISNRQNAKLDTRAEFNKVARHISSVKAIPHGSPLETSPLVGDVEGLMALNLATGSGKKTLHPADRDKFRKFKEQAERQKRVEIREEIVAKFRPIQVKEDRSLPSKTPTKSEEGSPLMQPVMTHGSSSATPSALDGELGFGSQILRDEDAPKAPEEECEDASPDVKTQRELPRLKTDTEDLAVDEDDLGDENSGRGLNPHAMPFNPGQAYQNNSESNGPLTRGSGSDLSTAADPSPRPSVRDVSESPRREVKPFTPEALEEYPPLPPPQMPEALMQPIVQPSQPTVLIRPQPPPPPPRVVTPPPPPPVMQEVHPASMVMPMVRQPPPQHRPNRQIPSPGGHRTPAHNPMHQEPPPNMMIANPPMMQAPQSGPPPQSSGVPHHSNGQPPQMVPQMVPHMSGGMHMMPQPMAHYPYPEMAGRMPIMYPYGHMPHVPGPPAPPGQQNNPNSDQPMPPPQMVYSAYYGPMASYHVPGYGPHGMPPGLPPGYVPMAPAPMTSQRPSSGGSRPRPQRRKQGSFLYAQRRG